MPRRLGLNWPLGFGLVVAVLAACTAAPTPAVPGYPAPGEAPTQAAPPTGYPAGPDVSQALIAAATTDLAQRAGVDAASIQMVEITPQTWPDASLGCPVEGQLYSQVVTEGYRIVLEAGGQRYVYHTDQVTAAYCEQDQG